MKVTATVEIQRTNYEDHEGLDRPTIQVHSTGRYSKSIILEINDCLYTVDAAELADAIRRVESA